jgi:1-deoxy-D-xylulose-5-phosphate reductoisomerase
MKMKRISILGSTGSIGTNALRVVEANPEKFSVQYLTAGKNAKRLIEQARKFHPKAVAIVD